MEKMFVDAHGSIDKVAAYAEKVKQLAIMIGVSEKGLNCHNALLACEKALGELMDYRREAEALGKPLSAIIKSHKESSRTLSSVPSELNFAPPHWVEESSFEKVSVWKNSRKVDKIYKTKEVTPAMAQRLRSGLQGQLESLFNMVKDQDWSEEVKESYKKDVIDCYRKESYREFSETLAKALWILNLGEEEFPEEPSDEDPGTLSCDSPEFETCVEFATVYSKPVRDHLVEWAKENGIRIHRELLVDWAEEYPDRLFSELMRKRFQRDKPISDWILLALTERELASGDSLGWSDQVSFEMIERMIEESARIEEGPNEGLHHQGVIDSLAETSLQFIS